MGHSVEFAGVNVRMTAPRGQEETVRTLPVFRNDQACVSCWQLTEEEIREVVLTGRVWLSVFMSGQQPPVFIGGEENTRGLVADYGGVWKREANKGDGK